MKCAHFRCVSGVFQVKCAHFMEFVLEEWQPGILLHLLESKLRTDLNMTNIFMSHVVTPQVCPQVSLWLVKI